MTRLTIALLLVTSPLFVVATEAQEATAEPQELAAILATIQAGRKDTIRSEIYFTRNEAAAFWPAYDAYVLELQAVRDRRVKMIRRYLVAYNEGSVSEEFALELIASDMAIKADVLSIRNKHMAIIQKILPPFKAARFYQLENKLDAEVNGQLARELPLIDPV
jgi:hypothetical protein